MPQQERQGSADTDRALTIRRAEPDDAEAIAELAGRLALADGDDAAGTTGGFLVSGYDAATYRQQTHDADHFYVACDWEAGDGRVVGFVLAYSDDRIGKEEVVNNRLRERLSRFVVIKQVAVDPDLGRRGVASRLYEHVQRRIGGTGQTQLVAAVVDDPPNVVSARFHRRRGFSPILEMVGPDGKPRVIWRWAPESDDASMLVQQYEECVGLYKHEDELNWTKLRNYIYITVALAAACGFLLESGLDDLGSIGLHRLAVVLGLAGFGVLTSVGYLVALRSGLRYLSLHKESLSRIEDQFVRHGCIRLLPYRSERTSPIGRLAPTTYLFRYAPIVGLLAWVAVISFFVTLLR